MLRIDLIPGGNGKKAVTLSCTIFMTERNNGLPRAKGIFLQIFPMMGSS